MRKPRIRQLKSYASYHVICKINRDEIIFDKTISVLFLQTLERCKKNYSFRVQNFNIIGNHVHFILTPGKNSPLPNIMQWLNSVFAKAYNRLTGQSGHVWKERYFSKIIETARQFIATFEYIVKNPIEAKLVKNAKDYQFGGLYHYIHKIKGIVSEEAIICKLYEHCRDFHR
jgi:REP element-mobilizing transposase RayT